MLKIQSPCVCVDTVYLISKNSSPTLSDLAMQTLFLHQPERLYTVFSVCRRQEGRTGLRVEFEIKTIIIHTKTYSLLA